MGFSDSLNEECGIFCVTNLKDAVTHCVLGLHALQHRGQEAAGLVTSDGNRFYSQYVKGLVGDKCSDQDIQKKLPGNRALGHVRYSTTKKKGTQCSQPIVAEIGVGNIAVAHNGNFTNAFELRSDLIKRGCIFTSSMDTEILIHLIAIQGTEVDVVTAIKEVLKIIRGAYSLVFMFNNMTIIVRDKYGIRPLVMGMFKDSYVFSSETCALDIMGATYNRDVNPGEMIVIDSDGISMKHFDLSEGKKSRFCIFEYIYFLRPDSYCKTVDSSVYEIRKKIGEELALEDDHNIADIVIPIPDSGIPSAIGYALVSNLPCEFGITRNHYVGRTFIEPTDKIRNLGIKLKHNTNNHVINGKKVILIDDSIIRGNTSRKIVSMVREAGALEVHLRISSPPTKYSCFYGVDTPEESKLIAHTHSLDEMKQEIGVDSLKFISINGLYKAISGNKRDDESPQFCDACFTGKYMQDIT